MALYHSILVVGGEFYKGIILKKISLGQQALSPNFIGSWIIDPLSICDELINYFESNRSKQTSGVVAGGKDAVSKNSIDIKITPDEIEKPGNEPFKRYFNNLFSCFQNYTEEWPFLTEFATNLQIGEFNLQRYQSGQHFQKVHTERMGLSSLHRIFAWMTYLNDVDVADGGATVFSHYGLEIQPKKGLTLIWPAEWTHAHKGSLLNSNSKSQPCSPSARRIAKKAST